MKNVLIEKVIDRFEQPVLTPRDCELLSAEIRKRTGRSISSTTLRRFFGMLSSKTELSGYNLDTLARFCGSASYQSFCNEFGLLRDLIEPEFNEILNEIGNLTSYTLNSIFRRSLTPFSKTIARKAVNVNLDSFLSSEFTVFPLIAPGGYGKSLALSHWIRDHLSAKADPNSFLFCQASMLSRLLVQGKHSTKQLNLNLADSQNLIQQFPFNFEQNKRHLVLVIDGMDEPENDTRGILALASFIRNAAAQFHTKGFLKIVLAVREVTWNKFLMPEFMSGNPPWLFYSKVDSLESGSSNLQVLSNTEVKEILQLHNDKLAIPVVYDCIDWRMRELIRIPLNLFVFTSLVARAVPMSELTPDLLLLEYINTIVFKTRFAEEKADILWKLVEFTLESHSGFSVRKSHLKNIYPIHLKKESNYFSAYQDLLSMGILNEKLAENKYGLMQTQIEFKHTNFYYYICALYLIDVHDEIDKDLFRRIIKQAKGIEWRSNVLSFVYQLAFANEDFETLKDFCDLDESILSSLPIRHTVGITFRQSNQIRIPLIEQFAAHPVGQVYFFEQFVDTNYIFNNYEFRIREFLKHKTNNEAKLFGNSVLFLANFLKMNLHGCRQQMDIIGEIEADQSIHPWPIGRKVSTSIFFKHIVEENPIPDLEAFIDQYQDIAYLYEGYLDNGMIEFEMSVMVALVLIDEYKTLIRMIKRAHESYNLADPAHQGFTWIHQHQNRLADIFLDYAQFRMKGKPGRDTISRCEIFLNNYVSFFDDFQYLILINLFLVDYYTYENKEEQARSQFQNALDLAKHAKYTFYEAYLLNKGARFNPEYAPEALKLIEASHFFPESVCFQHRHLLS